MMTIYLKWFGIRSSREGVYMFEHVGFQVRFQKWPRSHCYGCEGVEVEVMSLSFSLEGLNTSLLL